MGYFVAVRNDLRLFFCFCCIFFLLIVVGQKNLAHAAVTTALCAVEAAEVNLQDKDSIAPELSPCAAKSIPAVKTNKAPTIDGRMAPGEWQQAAIIKNGLYQIQPLDGAMPTYATDIYVSYDAHNLYVAARMYDDAPEKIVARQMIQGAGLWSEDNFQLILSPFNNKQSGFFFRVNANGVREDALFEGANARNFNWDAIWQAKSSIDEKGWVTEMRIPIKSLNFNPNNEDWGISFGRAVARLNENHAWTSYNRRIGVDTVGTLTGMRGLKQGLGLDIVGSLAARQDRTYDLSDLNPAGSVGSDYGDQLYTKNTQFEPSLDVFYNITPSLTAVLTVNTDFSATDVDDQVVNLSRFSVFLPERRDFFLQDADIFNFGGINRNGRPFFSRTIGLGDEGQELKMRLGGKLTGRLGKWDVGILDVIQESLSGEGSTNLLVARVQRRLLEQSTIGAIVTYGDPLSDKKSYTIGADAKYRDNDLIKNKIVEANFWGQKTHTPLDSGEVDEDVAGDTDGDDSAYGFELDINTAEGWYGGTEFSHFGEDFDPALGFANRVGIDRLDYFGGYVFRPVDSIFRRLQIHTWQGNWWDTSGGLQSRGTHIRPIEMEFMSRDRVWVDFNRNTEVLTEPFEILDGIIIPSGRYSFNQYSLTYDSAGNRKIGAFARFRKGDYYTGKRTTMIASLRIQPNKYLRLQGRYTQNKIDLAEGEFTTRQFNISSDVAFNSSLSWITRIQYNNVSRQAAINSRLRYNPEAGQDFFLIVNHGAVRDDITDRFRSVSNQIAAKIAYTLRF